MFSVPVVLFAAMILNIMPTMLGLPYFTISLAALGSFFYKELRSWLEVSRLKQYKKTICVLTFAIIILAGVVHWLLSARP